MKNIFLAVALLAAGCDASQGNSSWPDYSLAHVWIDDPNNLFSDEELTIIDNALTEWSVATDYHVTFNYVPGKGAKNLIIIRPEESNVILTERGVSAVTDYVPWEAGGAITVPSNIDERRFRLIMLHELGHTLGLTHNEEEPTTIMFHLTTDSSVITCNDVTQFCDENDCVASEMPPCQGNL